MNRSLFLKNGKGNYRDDEPLIIPGAAQGICNNKLFTQDVRLLSRTEKPYLLLHVNGRRTIEIICSRRELENNESHTHSFWKGARFLSVMTYLDSYAIRTKRDYGYDETHLWGIEWESTYNCVPGNVAYVRVPTLIVGMTENRELLASELIYTMSASSDKSVAFVEGRANNDSLAGSFESAKGPDRESLKIMYDYIDEWLWESGRFL